MECRLHFVRLITLLPPSFRFTVPLYRIASTALLLLLAFARTPRVLGAADVGAIVAGWLKATQADFDASVRFSYRERIRDDDGTKTYDVVMLDGSPFRRLISVDDRRLDSEEADKEQRRLDDEKARRDSESAGDRAERIADYEKRFERAHRILEEMPHAFQYSLEGTQQIAGYTAYVLYAKPRKGYDPPSTEAEVLTGMQGRFWIETKSDQLIRGVVEVLKPVTLYGFVATVQPGTEFEFEQTRIGDGLWLPTHLQIRSHSHILFLFRHHVDEDRTFSNYRADAPLASEPAGRPRPAPEAP